MLFVWLLLYGSASLLSHHFAPLTPWAVPVGLLVCAAPLVGWLLRRGTTLLGFPKLTLTQWKHHLFFLPYLLPVFYHLFYFGFQLPSVPGLLGILLAAVLEEVLFRGILPLVLCRRGDVFCAVLSSLIFAAAHLVNLERGASPVFVLCQVLFALSAGLAFFGIVLSCGSLLPCMGIHFLINLTAPVSPPEPKPLLWLCIAVYFACGIRSIYLVRKSHQERVFL